MGVGDVLRERERELAVGRQVIRGLGLDQGDGVAEVLEPVLAELLGERKRAWSSSGRCDTISLRSSPSSTSLPAAAYDFAIENVSRNVPPRWAVTTISPAVGGPCTTTCHSSAVKSALPATSLL